MRANKFTFAFGLFAVLAGIVIGLVSLMLTFGSSVSATGVLTGSIVTVIGLAFLSIDHNHIRYASLALVFLGIFYYFYFHSHQHIFIALIISVIIIAVIEYGLRHR
ncbi:hypothetical protein [Lentilactobacillus sp. Marseille-Q4993]|uniref:hypothetical protein n=1 Tax=Lentilactobacillus sp. Marseille-Q4993 TaxID=3039492 RepID=UPI0024BCC0F3|nr:hypothetical protein [Lentilactobacillus sp. Marseille-Q4993]